MDRATLPHTLTTAFSMGMVVLLSPEVFILALVMAAHQTRARLNSTVFFLGAAIGLLFALALGIWITPSTTSGAEHHSWFRFGLRASIGTALLAVGLYRTWQFLTGKDDRNPKPKSPPTGLKAKLLSFFPSLNTSSEPTINTHYLSSTFLIGLTTTGLHPKTSILAFTVGHEIARASDALVKIFAFSLFSFLSLLPAIVPLLLAIFRPQAGPAIKEKCSDLLEKNGRWIAALICFAFAFILWKDALSVLPR